MPRGVVWTLYVAGLLGAAAAGASLVEPAQATPAPRDAADAVAICRAEVLDAAPGAEVGQVFAYHERTGFRVDGVLTPSGTPFRCGVRFDGAVAYAAVPPTG